MRLKLRLPPDALERSKDGGFEITRRNEPSLRIEIDPLLVAPDDRREWMRALLEREVLEDCSVRVLGSTQGTTERGWPLEIVDTIVVRGRDVVVEHRLAAVYDMLGHIAAVTVHASDGPRYAEQLQPYLLPLVASAWPDWRSRVPAALSELWCLDVTPPSD